MMVSESANGVGVLAASYDASEVGGGVFGEGGDDLTEEERETVSHVYVKRFDDLPNTALITVTITYKSLDTTTLHVHLLGQY